MSNIPLTSVPLRRGADDFTQLDPHDETDEDGDGEDEEGRHPSAAERRLARHAVALRSRLFERMGPSLDDVDTLNSPLARHSLLSLLRC